MIDRIDGVAYEVRAEADLGWIRRYGFVTHVFDRQDSGNLCFCVEGPYGKLFIKYAGERTINYLGRPGDAAIMLEKAMPVYENRHPSLTELVAHGPAGRGYAAVFRWVDAQCLRPNPPDPAVYDRLRALPPLRSLNIIDGVYDLHLMLARKGLIAVDFYDGNVLIDFVNDRAIVCDIDLYRPAPAVNDRGRMQGSSRFLSPEEYQMGAALDECTNVYALGALAFEFFGSNLDRSREQWRGLPRLYAVASQATSAERRNRYPTVAAFVDAWRGAVRDSWIR